MVISRVIIRVTPFKALITLLTTYLLSPLPLQVGFRVQGFGSGLGLKNARLFGGWVNSRAQGFEADGFWDSRLSRCKW